MKIDEFQNSSFRAENPTWIYFLQFLKKKLQILDQNSILENEST